VSVSSFAFPILVVRDRDRGRALPVRPDGEGDGGAAPGKPGHVPAAQIGHRQDWLDGTLISLSIRFSGSSTLGLQDP